MDALRILIVEDEAIIAEDLKSRLEKMEYTITGVASTGSQAIMMVGEHKPDLILMDIVLKGEMDGIEAAGIIQENHDIPVIYLTAFSDEEMLDRASVTEPYGYLVKPFKDREVHASIRMAYSKYKLEKEVKKNRDWLAYTLKCIGDAVIVIDQNGAVSYINKVAQEMTGWSMEEAVGRPLREIFALSDMDHLKTDDTAFTEGKIAEYSLPTRKGGIKYLSGTLLTKNKAEIPIEDSFSAIHAENGETAGAVVVFRDITERKKAEEEKELLKAKLHQAQKMEAIGTLAGGIAHDFNNILGVILGYADLAKEGSPPHSTIAKDIEQIIQAGFRARDLVKQILDFSRQTDVERIVFQPASVINEAIKMLGFSIPTTIEIHADIDTCGEILADPSQLHQVLMNLCTNAFHAMEETGGELYISLKKVELRPEDFPDEPGQPGGNFIELTVRDTGPGIEPSIVNKIFEPYFTTKEIGKGTGMGLAIVHGIVKSYGGAITFKSKPGSGSAFQVFFPVIETGSGVEEKATEKVAVGRERVLFVDDEDMLAEMGTEILKRLGYKVTKKTSSLEALEIFQNQPDQFDLIITDQTMPGMTGADLAERILQIRPDMPIILCTGYSTTMSEEKAKEIGIKEFALKPLVKKDIARLIRKVLDVS